MGGGPILRNPFSDPLGFATDISGGAILKGQLKTASAAADVLDEPVLNTIGIQSADQKREQMAQDAATAEGQARADLYNQSIGDRNIDEITRRELVSLYQGGSDSGKIASTLSNARQGKGIYAIRRINQNIKEQSVNSPGRRQTVTGRGSQL